jgi:YfiH family protein
MIYYTSTELPPRHGFFTRNGGVSTGLYASLNCSFSSDDPENVRQNRALVAEAMETQNLLGLKQVHGTKVVTVTEPWTDAPQADAMVTATPGLALGIITADCVPVLLATDDVVGTPAGVIGAVHAGWRGAVAGILEETVAAMHALGAQGQNIKAVIGPCIHQQNYEVRADLRDAVLAATPDAEIFFSPGRPDHWQFNLPGYCSTRLYTLGITTEILPHDTFADEQNFFSHRRRTLRAELATGHQISVITL